MTTDKEREAFERIASQKRYNLERLTELYGEQTNYYLSRETEMAWLIWQSRAAQDTALVEALQNIAITAQQASLHDPEQFCSWAYDRATQALAQHQQKEGK